LTRASPCSTAMNPLPIYPKSQWHFRTNRGGQEVS